MSKNMQLIPAIKENDRTEKAYNYCMEALLISEFIVSRPIL